MRVLIIEDEEKFSLLSVLARRQGQILSKTAIAEMVWDINFDSNSGNNHGLGLAIVKAIALMHGADVFVRSDHGMNTFGIHLPV